MTIRLHYIHDPLCGWCYAAAPLAEAAAAVPGVEIVLHGGGLFPEPAQLAPAMVSHIRAADARIAQMTGQAFGRPYLDELLPDPALRLHSLPPIAAVMAAEELAGQGLGMHVAIQRAHYVDGKRVVEPETLADLAQGLGLDREAFVSAFARQPVADHLSQTRRLMARFGLGGFPGFVRESDGRFDVLPHTQLYGQPGKFADLLKTG